MISENKGLKRKELFDFALTAVAFSVGVFFVVAAFVELDVRLWSVSAVWGLFSAIFLLTWSFLLCRNC